MYASIKARIKNNAKCLSAHSSGFPAQYPAIEGFDMIGTRLLQFFLAVAEEQSITMAAEYLHITQPTLSKQMMELEAVYEQATGNIFIKEKAAAQAKSSKLLPVVCIGSYWFSDRWKVTLTLPCPRASASPSGSSMCPRAYSCRL